MAGAGAALSSMFWPQGILPFCFLFGICAFPLYALSVAHTNDFVPPSNYVEAASGLNFAYAIAAVVGPLVASSVMVKIGPGGLFAFTAAVHAVLAFYAVLRIKVREMPPEEERIQFKEAILVAQTLAPINPAADQPESETGGHGAESEE